MVSSGKNMALSGSYLRLCRGVPSLALALRPKHWIKNVFVFAPLLFSGHFRNRADVYAECWAFVIFSVTASVVLNDTIAGTVCDQRTRSRMGVTK